MKPLIIDKMGRLGETLAEGTFSRMHGKLKDAKKQRHPRNLAPIPHHHLFFFKVVINVIIIRF